MRAEKGRPRGRRGKRQACDEAGIVQRAQRVHADPHVDDAIARAQLGAPHAERLVRGAAEDAAVRASGHLRPPGARAGAAGLCLLLGESLEFRVWG